jgi:diguanylate cyclase (GGDEF)-like protein
MAGSVSPARGCSTKTGVIMQAALMRGEIEALLSGGGRGTFSPALEAEYERRLSPTRRKHLALALLLVAISVVTAALLDRADASAIFRLIFVLRAGVTVLCLAGAAAELFAATALQEAACYCVPLLGQVVLAAWAGRKGTPVLIDRNIVMSLMLFAVLCGVPPVPGRVARVLAAALFGCFVLAFWLIEGSAVLVQHVNGLAAGGAALLVGAVLSRQRESARRREFLRTLHAELTAAELSRVNAELERLMHTDVLTGVANRRRFEADLKGAWPEKGAAGRLGLLLVDVDHFKAFNDCAGHAEGDSCLRAVAGAIASVVRGGAFHMARWGGEEFVVLAPGIPETEVAVLAERVRRAVEDMAISHPAFPGRVVTASVGAAWCGEGAGCATSDMLLREADQALYEAKRSGRNRIAGPDRTVGLRRVATQG